MQFALFHTWHLKETIEIAPGVPVLDLLDGAAIGGSGGQSKHEVEAQAGYTNNGLGFRLSGNWQSPTRVDGALGTPTSTLNFGSLTTLDLRVFANFGQMPELVRDHPFLRGSRLTLSFTNLFGIGDNTKANQAANFGVTRQVATAPQRIGMGTPSITASSTVGSTILTSGDNSGALALESLITKNRSFGAAGGLAAQTGSLADYAASFYQNLSTRSNSITQAQATQDDRLQEAQSRVAANSGVSLDEELMNLTTYQQAYAAGARLLTVVDQLYDTLLKIQ